MVPVTLVTFPPSGRQGAVSEHHPLSQKAVRPLEPATASSWEPELFCWLSPASLHLTPWYPSSSVALVNASTHPLWGSRVLRSWKFPVF